MSSIHPDHSPWGPASWPARWPLAWDENAEGAMALTGQPELGVLFVPENKALVDASLAAITRAKAGPTCLLNWGIPTVNKTDFDLMHREIVSFSQMVLDLGDVPKASLSALDLTPL